MINIALFGAPGSGKGTQSKLLLEKYNFTYISTGDIIREEIAKKTPLGKIVKEVVDKGELLTDEIIIKIIEKKIKPGCKSTGFLFDGFPRTVAQACKLDELLLKIGMQINCVISLDVPQEELIKRLAGRAEKEDRADDKNLNVILHRINEYEKKTAPVADFYRKQNKFYSIDGIGTIEDNFERIDKIIRKKLK